MDVLQIDEILLNIFSHLYLDDILKFFIVNNCIYNKINDLYQNKKLILSDMPLFRSCNDITTYLLHYKSFISGENFPNEPLWLFNDINDPKYIQIDNKYTKLENMRFDKPKFFYYITSYKFITFKGTLYHWNKLNNNQKYLIWCAITNYHPEIKLDKSLINGDLAILLSELYWHYDKSFVRYYLEIYSIDNCDLINAKCIAKSEINGELERYRGCHFLQEFKNISNKLTLFKYCEYYLELYNFPKSGYCNEISFRNHLLNIQYYNREADFYSFKNLNLNSHNILNEINILNNIVNEMNDFMITKTNNLKTNNINYLTHMSINYDESTIRNNNENVNNCLQQ